MMIPQITNEELISALQAARVYVEPGTSGTTSQTQQYILDKLNPNDHIYVIILKDETTQSELATLVYNVAQKLGSDNIVVAISPNQAATFSNVLPSGESDDLLSRALSVSTNRLEVAVTFINNVHNWQIRNPKAEASVAVNSSDGSSDLPLIIGIGTPSFALTVAATLSFMKYRKNKKAAAAKKPKLRFSPTVIKEKIDSLVEVSSKIRDLKLKAILFQMTLDLDVYFQRNKHARDNSSHDAQELAGHLTTLITVLDRYVDVQNNARYFKNPAETMQSGVDAVRSFSEYVLLSVQRGVEQELIDYTVDTRILQSSRYK